MIEPSWSDVKVHPNLAARHGDRRLIVLALAALLLIGGGIALVTLSGGRPAPVVTAQSAPPAKNPVLDELVATTKALEASQQQVVDQLQAMQDMFTAQQAATKKSSDRVAALNEKVESLRQSFANVPQTATEAADIPPKMQEPAVRSPPKAHRRASLHRPGKSRKHRTASSLR